VIKKGEPKGYIREGKKGTSVGAEVPLIVEIIPSQ